MWLLVQALPKYLLNVQELNQAKEGEEVTLMVDMSSLGIKRKTLVKKLGQLPSHTAFTIRCQVGEDMHTQMDTDTAGCTVVPAQCAQIG